ncbi:MAG TPA: glycine cleavage system protein GcvH [Micropepsaceae bacterium]|nr:glycine cleavage system protein GcvH [Micropepsaceae bacterium]
MAELRFTESHEWVKCENGIASIGITRYAADQLGDIVHVELPQTGKKLDAGGEAAVVEGVKAASEIYTPLAGEVTEANRELENDLARINADPEQSWFFRMKLSDAAQVNRLMTRQQYDDYLKGL